MFMLHFKKRWLKTVFSTITLMSKNYYSFLVDGEILNIRMSSVQSHLILKLKVALNRSVINFTLSCILFSRLLLNNKKQESPNSL